MPPASASCVSRLLHNYTVYLLRHPARWPPPSCQMASASCAVHLPAIVYLLHHPVQQTCQMPFDIASLQSLPPTSSHPATLANCQMLSDTPALPPYGPRLPASPVLLFLHCPTLRPLPDAVRHPPTCSPLLSTLRSLPSAQADPLAPPPMPSCPTIPARCCPTFASLWPPSPVPSTSLHGSTSFHPVHVIFIHLLIRLLVNF